MSTPDDATPNDGGEGTPPQPPETSPEVSAYPTQDAEQIEAPTAKRVFVGTGLFWGLVVGIVLAVALIILAAQNTSDAQVTFLSWTVTTPLIAVILVVLLVGIVLDEIVGLVYRAQRRRVLQEREELLRLRARHGDE